MDLILVFFKAFGVCFALGVGSWLWWFVTCYFEAKAEVEAERKQRGTK